MSGEEYSTWYGQILSSDAISAYFGNHEVDVNEEILNSGCKTTSDLVNKGLVSVVEIPLSFAQVFQENKLDSLSMCNIFTFNK